MATAKKVDLKVKSTNFTGDDGKLIYPRAHYDHLDGKPTSYPPTAHDHTISEITGLQTALNSKLNLAGGTMTGAITMGSNNITGNNSSIFQAGRIIATNSNTSAHGITSSGSRANMLYLMNGVTGGLAASLLDVDVNNGTTPQKRIAKIGIYGGATSGTGGTPAATYLWLSSVNGNTYNLDATLKVDSLNRIGIAITGANRPTQALDVNGKIRMRTATVDADDADIVVTKGYMLSKIPTNTNNYLTGVSGSGNGEVIFTRQGLLAIPWDASHNHNDLYNTRTEITSLLAGKQDSLGYTPENSANKKTSIRNSGADNTSYVTELGVKTYVDGLIGSVYRPSGDWNAATNSPTLVNNTPANAGKVYRISVAGTRFDFDFAVGDKLAFNESGVISKWDNVDDVVSVNGQTGKVNLTTDDIDEGSNLYVSQSEKDTWNGKVSLSGAETISGEKTFNDGIIIPGSNKYIDLGNKTNWFWTRFSGENWTLNNTYTAGGWARNLMEMKNAAGTAYFRIGAQGNSQTFSQMYIGPAYNNYWLSLNNDRALFGAKPQYAGDPTTGNDLTRKSYVDSKLTAVAKGETSSKTLAYGGTFKVLQTLANGTVEEHTMTMPTQPTNTNNYLTGVSGSGNGEVIFTRQGLFAIPWDATHEHNELYNTRTEITSLLAGKANDNEVVLATTENKNILGTTESVFNIKDKKVWFDKGALFYGTALNAGLVTRGISGTNATGSTKDHLYINYDGNNTLSRQLVLGAGSIGTARGHGIYDYSAVRGDAFIAYLNGTLGSYEKTITGAATTITSSNLTTNRALISNGSGKVAVSAVTSTELGYLDGVTSAIQTQLNTKPTISGTPTADQFLQYTGSGWTPVTFPNVGVIKRKLEITPLGPKADRSYTFAYKNLADTSEDLWYRKESSTPGTWYSLGSIPPGISNTITLSGSAVKAGESDIFYLRWGLDDSTIVSSTYSMSPFASITGLSASISGGTKRGDKMWELKNGTSPALVTYSTRVTVMSVNGTATISLPWVFSSLVTLQATIAGDNISGTGGDIVYANYITMVTGFSEFTVTHDYAGTTNSKSVYVTISGYIAD